MADLKALDIPIWSTLTSGWAEFAEGDARALRLNQDYGPFGAAADATPSALNALSALIPSGREIWLVQREIALPPGTVVVRSAPLHQMVAEHVAPGGQAIDFVALGDEDGAEMLALALLTRPGPFARLTHRLGDFIGVKQDGVLVAMAGERMRLDRFAEVSGVCTHPDHRGRGYAAALMRIVARRILDRGEMPFLHSYSSNGEAIALYERLGFRLREVMQMAVIVPADG